MTLQEIKEKIDGFTDEERVKYLRPLCTRGFSDCSLIKINDFQRGWDGEKDFSEFKKEQNIIIRECIDTEVSEEGKEERIRLGMEPITLETEVIE